MGVYDLYTTGKTETDVIVYDINCVCYHNLLLKTIIEIIS